MHYTIKHTDRPIYFILTIDTECDKGAKWKVQQPLAFTNIAIGINRYLSPLLESMDIPATYLLSPEVLRHKASVDFFKSLNGRNELGTHLHSEFIAPNEQLDSNNTSCFQFELKEETERQKLKNLSQLFEEQFGYKAQSFRAGRFGLGSNSLPLLQELGYKVDSSMTPDTYWMKDPKEGVNFIGSPYQPFFPSNSDFRRKGKVEVLEVPVTTLNTRLLSIPSSFKRILNANSKWQRVLFSTIFQPKGNLTWLRPTYATKNQMIELCNQMIHYSERKEMDKTVLCMMFHSNELCLGTSPYSLSEPRLQQIKENLSSFLVTLRRNRQVQFISLSEAAQLYKK